MYTDQLASICSQPLGPRLSPLLEEDQLLAVGDAALSQETGDAERTIKGLKKELRSLERKIQNLIDGLEVGGLREEINKRIEERQHEKAQVLSRLARLEAGQPGVRT